MRWKFSLCLRDSLSRVRGIFIAAMLWPFLVHAQSADDGFKPMIGSGTEQFPGVYTIAVQDDGKILLAGAFASVGGQTRNRLARVNVDGSLDMTFAATEVDAYITQILVQADHRIVIAGSFEQVGIYARHHIARLNSDGSVDASFDAHLQDVISSGTPVGSVRSLALQADGKLIVAGIFSGIGGQARTNIARLLGDGSADPGFNPVLDGTMVRAIAIQPDGQIVISGSFSHINGQAQNALVRLTAAGGVDNSFVASVDQSNGQIGVAFGLAVQPDGKILVVGEFTSIDGQPRQCLARLQSNGSLDYGYLPGTLCDPANNGDYIYKLVLQPDGKLIVGGQFTTDVPVLPQRNIARLQRDGSPDPNMVAGLATNDVLSAIAVEPNGGILIGGAFTVVTIVRNGIFFNSSQAYVARLDAYQISPLVGNSSGADGAVLALALQPDGKLLVGGDFSHIHDWSSADPGGADVPRTRLARLNPDHSLDLNFVADTSGGIVSAVVVQPDGKILVGGTFTSIGGVNRNRLARLNADGSIDANFDPNADNIVYTLALQNDGSILVGGGFQNIGNFATGNYHIPYFARLLADGSVDPTYYNSADNYVYTIALQADGSALIGGEFASLQTLTRNNVARILASGAIDTSFDPGIGTNGGVYAIALQPDGKIVVGGGFGSFAHNNDLRGLARLNNNGSVDAGFVPYRPCLPNALALQADGRLIVAGEFYASGGLTVDSLLRMNSDGSADPSFAPHPDALVVALALQGDGELIAGGDPFTMIGGRSRANLAWLSTAQPALQALSINGNSVNWKRSGSGAELTSAPILEFSVAGSLYAALGPMHHVAGGWQLDGYAPPIGQSFFLRARAGAASGTSDGSAGLIENARWFEVGDAIFANGFQ